ncbi:unnamed protein product [Arctogadus glacialis]
MYNMSKLRSAMQKGKRSTLTMTETTKTPRKRTKEAVKKEEEPTNPCPQATCHTFHEPASVLQIQKKLLNWYDKEKRELPWRTVALKEPDVNIRTYAVWVSEIMLQQTQVATVIEYYNRWMKRWPTVQDLAAASLEEVNKMWAGLGYYSRGRRLHEGAQKVVTEMEGQMPRTVDSLLKQLPGVGRYTAGAIGSIALGEVSGVVDGNVIRVLCRLRAIGADSTSSAVTEALWTLANTVVDPERPGEFNQALMELGARVCTPKAALCGQCPLKTHCHSYRKVHVKQEANSKKLLGKVGNSPSTQGDIEDCPTPASCTLCPTEPWLDDLGVHNFPRKPAKKAPRVERTLTCVARRPSEDGEDEYLLTQRPNKGLLAGMWEFPSLLLDEENSKVKQKGALCAEVGRILGVKVNKDLLSYVGEVVHIFSHIHQTYIVYSVSVEDEHATEETQSEKLQWLSRPALLEAAVSTGLKKILKLYETMGELSHEVLTLKDGKRKKVAKNSKLSASKKNKPNPANGTRQLSLNSFFKTTEET